MKTVSKFRGNRICKVPHSGRPLWVEPLGSGWWFNLSSGEWQDNYPTGGNCMSSYYSMNSSGFHNIYSLKAAKRKISKWNVPKGTWFRVSIPYVGYNFKVKK